MSIRARARLAGRAFAAAVLTIAAMLSASTAAHAIDLDPITCNRPDSEPGDRYEVHDDGTCTFLGPRDPSAEPPGFVPPLAFRTPKVGRDRYRTSAVVAAKDFADASTIVLTSGRTLADAVSAGPLASRLHAPVVLVDTNPACTSGFCVTLDAMPARGLLDDHSAIRRVIIVGGAAAVSASFEDELRGRGLSVERVFGPDRYATSTAVASRSELAGATAAFVTSGTENHLADAVAAGGVAGALRMPVLLADPGSTAAADVYLGANKTSAVTLGATDPEVTRRYDATRLAGADRAATSLAIATWAVERGVSAEKVTMAASTGVPDALVASAYGQITLFVPEAEVGQAAYEWLIAHKTVLVTPIGGRTPLL